MIGWFYRLLGFRKIRVMPVDSETSAIEVGDNDDYELPWYVLEQLSDGSNERGYIWVK